MNTQATHSVEAPETTLAHASPALVTAERAERNPAALIRQATDVAGVCRAIVLRTACEIQRRKYVKVEGWMAIAAAHGCVAGARDVERIEDGVRAIGEVRRISDGTLVSQAEGFVGDDEKSWADRPEYARRAMVQTRAISRACRSAFAHVVVLIDANLSTTPAEEVPEQGFSPSPARESAPKGRVAARAASPVAVRTQPLALTPQQLKEIEEGWRFLGKTEEDKRKAFAWLRVTASGFNELTEAQAERLLGVVRKQLKKRETAGAKTEDDPIAA